MKSLLQTNIEEIKKMTVFLILIFVFVISLLVIFIGIIIKDIIRSNQKKNKKELSLNKYRYNIKGVK